MIARSSRWPRDSNTLGYTPRGVQGYQPSDPQFHRLLHEPALALSFGQCDGERQSER